MHSSINDINRITKTIKFQNDSTKFSSPRTLKLSTLWRSTFPRRTFPNQNSNLIPTDQLKLTWYENGRLKICIRQLLHVKLSRPTYRNSSLIEYDIRFPLAARTIRNSNINIDINWCTDIRAFSRRALGYLCGVRGCPFSPNTKYWFPRNRWAWFFTILDSYEIGQHVLSVCISADCRSALFRERKL